MPAQPAIDLIVATVVATLFVLVSVLAFAAAIRLRSDRMAPLLLGWAMAQHATDVLLGGGPIVRALGDPTGWTLWTSAIVGHFIAVPWARLLQELIGPGWKNSIALTWRALLAAGLAAVIADVSSGRPGRASEAITLVNAAGALVGFLNLFRSGPASELRVLRVGFLAFLALVVLDAMARAGWLPWRSGTGPIGVLTCIGAIAFTVIARTLRSRGELHALEHELATARRIQASLLPAEPPRLQGAAIAFRYQPATAVAGDIFEFVAATPRTAGVLVADVSGHGVPAALIASMVKVAAAAQQPHAEDPARVLAGIHLALARELPRGHFVTAVYVYLDLDRGVLRHASAGHPPALLCRSGGREVVAVGATGPLLIAFAPAEYPVSELAIAAGDCIVLYTDGVVEAMRADDEMFGVERLSALMAAARNGPESLLDRVLQAVSAFVGRSSSLDDDCTLVALEIGRAQPPAAAGAARA